MNSVGLTRKQEGLEIKVSIKNGSEIRQNEQSMETLRKQQKERERVQEQL